MTAEEFAIKNFMDIESGYSYEYSLDKVQKILLRKAMIEFAKYHVEQAARMYENRGLYDITTWSGNPYTGEGSDYLDVNKMLKGYPLENIK